MSTTQTLILGAIAGLTIYVGLPMGRVSNVSPKMRAALSEELYQPDPSSGTCQ